MRDEVARNNREARYLDITLLQLEDIPAGGIVDSIGRDREMISAKGLVLVGEVSLELSDDTRHPAPGGVKGKGNEEEVDIVGISGEEGLWRKELRERSEKSE